jgi:hypothetical protein
LFSLKIISVMFFVSELRVGRGFHLDESAGVVFAGEVMLRTGIVWLSRRDVVLSQGGR